MYSQVPRVITLTISLPWFLSPSQTDLVITGILLLFVNPIITEYLLETMVTGQVTVNWSILRDLLIHGWEKMEGKIRVKVVKRVLPSNNQAIKA